MTAQEVLSKVVAAGGQIIPDPDRPRLLVPPALEFLVVEHREALRQLLLGQGENLRVKPETLQHLLLMPLDRFAVEGLSLEGRVPWLAETLWFVPTEADAEALAREGVSRGRIWTSGELMDLMAIPGLTPEQVRTIARAKLTFGGEVVAVFPRRRGGLA